MTQKITPLNLESLAALASADQPPCLSLYQPTHRRHPENKQDRIRFRNLVKEMEGSLRQAYPTLEAQQLLKPFEELAQDHTFWDHTQDGLAVLAGPLLFHVFSLPLPVEELVVVANSFHTKPLRRILQSADRFQGFEVGHNLTLPESRAAPERRGASWYDGLRSFRTLRQPTFENGKGRAAWIRRTSFSPTASPS